ncbi:hypothetical protein PRIPAC_89800, partial [Pristionchus pacificus]|uniref:NADH dehydrogenase [ubiquinone] 1 alpha subcomplex subunit 7 n=1 Tax=Pristionchus pacificus TaxID=54126 RepID=A0A8R1Z9J5_PRIPA
SFSGSGGFTSTAMTAGRKIAAATVQNRTQTPFWNWLRNKLLAVERLDVTPPPGLPGPDGKTHYNNPLRFPNTQAARSGDAPALPGGVHHKLEANYYKDRDGRRAVAPPAALYSADASGVAFGNQIGEKIEATKAVGVSVGPEQNFGLDTPTPGFGAEWTRSREKELDTPKSDVDFAYLEKFDRYAAVPRQ